MWRSAAAVLATGLVAVVPGVAPGASGSGPPGVPAASAACRAGQLPWRVEGRVRCLPAAALAPTLRPARPGSSPWVPALAHSMRSDWLKPVLGRRSRVHPLAGAIVRVARRAGARRIPKFARRLDARLTAGAGAARVRPAGAPVTLTQDLGHGTTAKGTGSGKFEGPPDGSVGGRNDFDLDIDIHHGGASVRMGIGNGEQSRADACPSAAGVVTGEMRSSTRLTGLVRFGGRVESPRTVRLTQTARLTGQVAGDAKLDSVLIDATTTVEQAERGLQVETTTRSTGRIDARAAAAGPVRLENVTGSTTSRVRGAFTFQPSKAEQAQLEREIATASARTGADLSESLAERALALMRRAEDHWYAYDACARIGLNPEPGTVRTQARQNGEFRAGAVSSRGEAAAGTFTATAQRGAVSPPSGSADAGSQAAFAYTAAEQAPDTVARADLTMTSPAGRAQRSWFSLPADTVPYFVITDYLVRDEAANGRGFSRNTRTLAPGQAPVTGLPASCSRDAPCGFRISAPARVANSYRVTGSPSPEDCPGGVAEGSFSYDSSADVFLVLQLDGGPEPVAKDDPFIFSIGSPVVSICNYFATAEPDVPVSSSTSRVELLSGRPVTFSFLASGTDAQPGSDLIDWTWEKSVTVRRVLADGSPYGG